MSARNFYTLFVTWTVLLPNGESQFRFDRAFASPTIFPRVRFPGGPRENSAQRRECALIIPDGGKQNFRDHNTGTFNSVENAYDGSDVCITYDDVDTAFLRAKNKVGLRTPKGGDVSIHDIGLLGTALQETTRYLAEEYSLSKHDILFGFPQIDTSKTVIGSFCPHFLRRKKCEVKRFREFDGSCNNLQNPHWGSARTPFRRLLQPKYGDGVAAPRLGRESYPLPNPRKVSAHVHRDGQVHDHAVTIMFVAWGQLIDHDLTLTAETKDPITKLEPDCCVTARRHPNCLPIELPPDDEFYQLHKQRCMSILRSQAGSRPGCRLGTRVQFNAITSFIDGSFIYGSSQKVADSLRSLKGGLLKTLPVFRQYGLKDLLPLKLDHPDDGCIRPSKDIFCFLAGDNRANEQLVLAVLHTMFMREHNSIATELSRVNPHWDDERLFQETRHIIAALVQHITFTEFLPMLLGKEAIEKYELLPRAEGYSSGYNPDLDATVTSSFITAAFRFGHSLLPTMVERWSPNNKYIASQRLSEMLRQPFDLYKGGWYDQYMMGLINQVAQAMDDAITNEVTNHLFQKPQKRYGMDLAAINVQRAREHGVPSYNEFRQFCGLPRMYEWNEMMHIMENVTVTRYQDVYRHPDDIDLWSGGVSEKPLPGSLVGPTFNCLIAQNFKNLKYGDRFWYENSGWPSAFTLEQLKEIRKIKLSRLLCNSGDRIEAVQVYAMVLPDYEINPRVPCKSKILPRMDFSKWKELGPQRSFTYVKYPGANNNRKPGVRNPVRFPAPDKSIRLPRPPRLQIPFSWYSRLLFS